MAESARPVQAELEEINGVFLLRLDRETSASLPSRGMVMAEGLIDGLPFVAPAEPDGRGGHFIAVAAGLAGKKALRAGSLVALSLAPAKAWPEPDLPADFLESLESGGLLAHWQACTVRGRWEWFRWLRAAGGTDTRQRRLTAACDKLRKGEKRPCCFNAAACTDPRVCKNGALIQAPRTAQ